MTRLAVVMDNEAEPGFESEWGLCLALTLADGSLWLWDAGASGRVVDNAARMGIDPARAGGLALSHGHWDHTGGLAALFEAGFDGPLYMHPAGLARRFRAGDPGEQPVVDIGIPGALPDIVPVLGPVHLAPGLAMLTDIQRIPGNHQATRGFHLDRELTLHDPVRDDALLMVRSESGQWSMVLGCCHAGLANSLVAARRHLGAERVHTVAGGLHLFDADRRVVDETARALADFGVERLLAGHCTGADALDELAARLDCRVEATRSGLTFDLFE